MATIYNEIGKRYALERCSNPNIATQIHYNLSGADSVLNVGAEKGNTMTKLIGSFLLIVIFSATGVAGTAEGVSSAIKWLEVVDSGEYVESWNEAAPYFRTQISSGQWEQALKKVRQPLGRVITRKVTNSISYTSLPGLPDGDYVVVMLSTSYEHKSSATETVTVSKAGDDWRAVGYFIK